MKQKIAVQKSIKDLEYQVSASKVFACDTEVMWQFLLSQTGIHIWFGKINLNDFEIQKECISNNDLKIKLTVFVPDCHLRFKWQPSSWGKASTVELRVKNVKGKSSIIFHHTQFFKLEQKEELRQYWKAVIAKMMVVLENLHAIAIK